MKSHTIKTVINLTNYVWGLEISSEFTTYFLNIYMPIPIDRRKNIWR